MKRTTLLTLMMLAAATVLGQTGTYITSFNPNGMLTFACVTSPVPNTTVSYDLEYAPSPQGPWSDSWTGLRDLITGANSLTVSVPSFYRVRLGSAVTVPTSLASGLALHCKFDGSAYDEVSRITGTTFASMTKDRFGRANRAFSFDGIDDYIDFPDRNGLDLQAFTIAMWVRFAAPVYTGQAGSGMRLVQKGATVEVANYRLHALKTLDEFGILWESEQNQLQHLSACTAFATNRYYHLVATFQNKVNVLYVNRHKLASLGTDLVPKANGGPLMIGDVRDYTYPVFHGAIDSLRIYGRALTRDEVEALYYVDE